MKIPIAQRFWRMVTKSDSCWHWDGFRNQLGYGMILDEQRKTQLAHRVSWEIANGAIPVGICVLHHCDNPSCVNPEHLFLGTKLDNSKDCVAKGRHQHGERHFKAKMKEADVLQARRLYASGTRKAEIARRFGVPFQRMRLALEGITWKHLPGQ